MTRFFIGHPVSLVMAMVACLLFGVLVLSGMELAFSPDTRQPGLTVIVNYPGVGPTEIDNLLTKRIEDAVARLPGVSRILSASSDGKSKLHLLYPYDTKLETATMDVLDALAPVAAAFPRDMEKPQVLRYDPSDAPVFVVSCSGANLASLRTWAERTLKPKFERIKGTSEVMIAGGEAREIIVAVDRAKAAGHGLSLSAVARAVQSGNVELPAGTLLEQGHERLVRTAGRFERIEDMRLVGVPGQDEPVPLSRVASVFRAGKSRDTVALADDREQVAIYVKKGAMASLVGVTKELRAVFDAATPPPGGKAVISYDAAEPLRNAVSGLVESALAASLITVAVLFFFLRKKSLTAIVAIAIPVSAAITFTLLGAFGIPLDMMTLSGLAVGIGMVVDNAVIVLAAILHARSGKLSTAEAAATGTNHVSLAITASTLTTVSVFLPVLFLSPEMRLLFGHLALAITCLLFASLFVAIAAVPVATSRALGRERPMDTADLETGTQADHTMSTRPQKEPRLVRVITRATDRLVAFAQRRKSFVLFATVGLVVTAGVAAQTMGREVIAPFASETVFLYVEFPSGTNLERTQAVTTDVAAIVRKLPWVKKTESRVEKAHAVVTVKLKESAEGGIPPVEAIAQLTSRFRGYRSAFVHLGGSGSSGSSDRNVTIEVVAETVAQGQEWAKKGAAVTGRVPGIEEVVLLFKEGAPELVVRVDRKKAAGLGLDVRTVGMEIRSAIFGPVATKYIDRGREVDVRVRHAGGTELDPEKLRDIPISVGEGKTVPLSAIASFTRDTASTMIFRKDGRLIASFRARYAGIDLGTAVRRIDEALATLAPSSGVQFRFGEEAEELEKSGTAGIFAVLIAVLLVYMVLAALYESFVLPFVVMAVVPVAGSAAILALFASGTPLSVPVYLGMIMLAGIVVNNSIIIVDDARREVTSGTAPDKAVAGAVSRRLRPMLITTCTAVFGLIPLLIGGGEGSTLYQPLALTMLAGMAVGLAGSIVLVPALFGRMYRTHKQCRTPGTLKVRTGRMRQTGL